MSANYITQAASQLTLEQVQRVLQPKTCDTGMLQMYRDMPDMAADVYFSERPASEVVPLINQVVEREFSRRAEKAEEIQHRDTEIWNRFSSPSLSSSGAHPFIVLRTFNISQANPGTLFFCGDRHGNSQCLQQQAALIGYLSQIAPVLLLIEGYPALQPVEHVFDIQVGTGNGGTAPILAPSLKSFAHNIHAVGWDDQGQIERTTTRLNRREEIVSERGHIREKRDERASTLSERLPAHLKLSTLMQTNQEFQLALQSGDLNQIREARDNLFPIFLSQVRSFMNSESVDSDLRDTCLAYEEFDRPMEQSSQKLKAENEEITQKLNDTLREDFPARTAAMITTLQGINEYRAQHGIEPGFTVVLAGGMHLERSEETPEYDLSSFYKELEEHHEGAVLLPEPVYEAIQACRAEEARKKACNAYMANKR